ncbi:hypothetical protein Tco_0920755 [Tanacetum coccineum]
MNQCRLLRREAWGSFKLLIDDFLSLSEWNETVVSKGEPIPDNERPMIEEKKEKLSLEKAKAKRAGESSLIAPKKKKARRNARLTSLESEGTISAALINQSILILFIRPLDPNKMILRRRLLTWASIPENILYLLWSEIQRNNLFRRMIGQKISMFRMGLFRVVTSVFFYRDAWCMISHLDNPLEDEVLPILTTMSGMALEEEKVRLVGELAQSEMACQSVVRDVIPVAISRLLTSVEYRKSLAVPIGLSFTADSLGGLSLGRTEEDIAAVLPNISNLDIEGLKV